MSSRALAISVLSILLFSSLTLLVSGDSEGRSIVRQRDSTHTFSWHGSATTVEVMGEWNNWTTNTSLTEETPGNWSVGIDLDPGLYCYKFVIDDNWIMDPLNPYTGYCDSFENSIARVENDTRPMYTHSIENQILTVEWHAGSGGDAPSGTPAALSGSTWYEGNWTWVLDLSGLEDGKHTIHIDGTDSSGVPADDLLLPFWIGEGAEFVWDDALIYMVMTDRFVNGNTSNDPVAISEAAQGADWMGGDLEGVTQQIESGYFTNLGVNALWLTPFNEGANGTGLAADGVHQVSAYHGYWPVEPRSIDPRIGTEENLHDLVDAAHDAGIRVMGDFVVNHVHEDHPYHVNHPDWFNEGCICGEPECDWTEHRLECLFRDYMPDVDWKERNASEQIIEDVLWWIETFDLDGGRIDAVKHVDDLAITNLAVRINERFETAGTDIYLKGETAMGWSGHDLASNAEQYNTINQYIGPNALDGQADFVLYHATSDRVFATGQDDYIHLDYWTARSQDQYTDGAVMVPFVGSHDVSRFASRADPGTADEWNQWVEQGLPGQPGTDDPYRASLQAHGWLLTTPGAPMVYMGDEYGDFGGADPDNRHMWRDNSTQNYRERGLLENISQLGLLRLELDSLRRGSYVSIHNSSDIVVFQRLIGEQSSLVALNRGSTDLSIDVGSLFTGHLTVFGDGGIENGTTLLNVTSHSVTILTNETTTVEPEPEPIQGCTDSTATNYNPAADLDDGSCTFSIFSNSTMLIQEVGPFRTVVDTYTFANGSVYPVLYLEESFHLEAILTKTNGSPISEKCLNIYLDPETNTTPVSTATTLDGTGEIDWFSGDPQDNPSLRGVEANGNKMEGFRTIRVAYEPDKELPGGCLAETNSAVNGSFMDVEVLVKSRVDILLADSWSNAAGYQPGDEITGAVTILRDRLDLFVDGQTVVFTFQYWNGSSSDGWLTGFPPEYTVTNEQGMANFSFIYEGENIPGELPCGDSQSAPCAVDGRWRVLVHFLDAQFFVENFLNNTPMIFLGEEPEPSNNPNSTDSDLINGSDNQTNSTTGQDSIVCPTDLCWDGSSRDPTDCSCPDELGSNNNTVEDIIPIQPNVDESAEGMSQQTRLILIGSIVIFLLLSSFAMIARRN